MAPPAGSAGRWRMRRGSLRPARQTAYVLWVKATPPCAPSQKKRPPTADFAERSSTWSEPVSPALANHAVVIAPSAVTTCCARQIDPGPRGSPGGAP